MGNSKYYTEIKRYITAKIRNPADSEDLTQQVFLKFYQEKNKDSDIRNQRAYLFIIARNLIAKHFQEKVKQPKIIPLDKVEENASILKEQYSTEKLRAIKQKKALKKSLKQLPLKDYETIKLCLSENFSIKKAARRAGTSYITFYKRYQQVLNILRKISQKNLEDDFNSKIY